MAQDIWQGTTSNWGTVGNWSLGAAPVSTNDVLFPATNSQDIDTSITTQDAIAVATMLIQSGCLINIGGSGNQLEIHATKVVHMGSGSVWYKSAQSAGGNTDLIVVNSPRLYGTSGDPAMDLDDDGTSLINRLVVLRGYTRVAAAATGTIAKVEVCGIQAYLSTLAGAGTFTTFTQTSGLSNLNNNVTTLEAFGGICTYAAGTIGSKIVVGAGARLIYNSTTTLPHVKVLPGGFVDFSKDLRSKTVTLLEVLPGGGWDEGPGNVTFTTKSLPNDNGSASLGFGGGGGV